LKTTVIKFSNKLNYIRDLDKDQTKKFGRK